MDRVLIGTALAAVVALALVPSASASEGRPEVHDHVHRTAAYEGLIPASEDSPCAGAGFEVDTGGPIPLCTHGPDAAPAGVDLNDTRSVEELAKSAPAPAGAGSVPCVGDGTSGNRVQAIYAVASDKTDAYDTVAPLIRSYADSNVEQVVANSADPTQPRGVRWLTTDPCTLVVTKVVLPPTGDDSGDNVRDALAAKGFNRVDRKYIVWLDTDINLCGIGFFVPDDAHGAANMNNGHPWFPGQMSVIDRDCWGLTGSTQTPVEAHELMHTLGAVQGSAARSTAAGHCTDDYDAMCYADGSGIPSIICPTQEHERLLDCGDNDYYDTTPTPGSYLDTKWNSADASFLVGAPDVCTIKGNNSNNTLTGTNAANVFCGLGGNDIIKGVGPGDIVFGGPGTDTLDFSGFSSRVAVFTTNPQRQVQFPDLPPSTPMLAFHSDIEKVKGTSHDDQLAGGSGADKFYGGGGNDFLLGGGGNDQLFGGGGNDNIAVDPGNDKIVGEAGTDLLRLDEQGPVTKAITVKLADGTISGQGSDSVASMEQALGSSKGDTIRGNGANNVFLGGDGNDKLFGEGGNDFLDGGPGTDTCNGGSGANGFNNCE